MSLDEITAADGDRTEVDLATLGTSSSTRPSAVKKRDVDRAVTVCVPPAAIGADSDCTGVDAIGALDEAGTAVLWEDGRMPVMAAAPSRLTRTTEAAAPTISGCMR